MSCEAGWANKILRNSAKVRSKYLPRDGRPEAMKNSGPGTSDFLTWAEMPEMTYSASTESLYDLDTFRRGMKNSGCLGVGEVDESKTTWKPLDIALFSAGLALASLSVAYITIRKR